jgi:putative membrane protein
MLWVKAAHIIAVVCWFAGIFYLPRLFVYHAMTDDEPGRARFVVMERKLFRFMTPFAVLTTVFGLWLLFQWWWGALPTSPWLHAKLALVVVLLGYHVWLGITVGRFARHEQIRSHKYYRVMNELPVLLLFAIVILVVVKPWAR